MKFFTIPYRLLFCFLACLMLHEARAQQAIFPSLFGPALLDSLSVNYKPVTVLPYSLARDTLYALIDIKNDSVACVYSGYKLYLPPDVDPTTYLANDGLSSGINCEHTYPKAKWGDLGNPESDMHHLYPSKVNVNSDRGNLPYAEIPDNQTVKWYYEATTSSSVPSVNIDLYSERTNDFFEPRESKKGNIARGIIYFYTMYRAEADSQDPNYFWNQRTTLCQWHIQDPADDEEIVRTWKIAQYQSDKPNPYVLDPSLALRAYCPELVSVEILPEKKETLLHDVSVFPNPGASRFTVSFTLESPQKVSLSIKDLTGKTIATRDEQPFPSGENQIFYELNQSGTYILCLRAGNVESTVTYISR